MSLISWSDFLLNWEVFVRCNISWGFPKGIKMINFRRELAKPSFLRVGIPCQQLPNTLAEKNRSIGCSMNPTLLRYPFFTSEKTAISVSYTHLRAHETGRNLVCRLLLEKKKTKKTTK